MDSIFIIAEAGVNHNGSIELAKQLVDAAAAAGANAVKFQTFKAGNLVCRNAAKAEYQLMSTKATESQYDMLKKLELSDAMHEELIEYCKRKGIIFLSSPFDIEGIKLLSYYNISIFKIPSGEITNYPYLKEIGNLGKKIILSTGMSNINEIRNALAILEENGAKDISLLHCNTEYPTPYQDVNLRVIESLKQEFGLPVGYSDHTKGIEVPIAAAAMGAAIIEKHFTLDKNMEGPDHKASLEPGELKQMVNCIRNIEKALGSTSKEKTESERKNVNIVRKSIVAKSFIKKGEQFTEFNLTTKRPGTGISPMKWEEVIGSTAKRDYMEDEMIEL